jgi:ABC-type Co2+ transport system permease subunit
VLAFAATGALVGALYFGRAWLTTARLVACLVGFIAAWTASGAERAIGRMTAWVRPLRRTGN